MTQLMKCRICGFVAEEGRLGAVCPACGVARKLFEPYTDPLEPDRRRKLALDIHPIVVHAPQALAFILLFLLVTVRFLPAAAADYVWKTVVVLTILLPFTVLGGFLTGTWDGKIRFQRLKTPMLKKKIVAGAILLLVAIPMPWLALTATQGGGAKGLAMIVLALAACVCCTFLGMIGAKLVHAVTVKISAPVQPQAPVPSR